MNTSGDKRDWEDLATLDPLWAVLFRSTQFGRWNLDSFFRTGEDQIAAVIDKARHLGYPIKWESALDFGCGVGRLTRALASYFEHSCGVDISETMVVKARELNQAFSNCMFTLNDRGDLQIFDDNHFDLIYSAITLQHISKRQVRESFIREFVRILKEGGLLVFQLPSHTILI